MDFINTVKSWVGALTELALMLIALAIAVSLLYGGSGLPFFGNASSNIVAFVGDLGKAGLSGLIALGIILWVFSHRKLS